MHRSSRSRLLRWVGHPALVGTMLIGTGCGGGRGGFDPEPVSYRVAVVEVRGSARPPSRAGDWLERAAEAALAEGPLLGSQDSDAELVAVSVRVAEIQTRDGPVVRLSLEATVPSALRKRVKSLDATVELERTEGSIDLRRDVPIALERAAAVLEAKLALGLGKPDAIAALLADPDAELVLLAMRVVDERHLSEHAPLVVPLLRHPDDRVVLAAVEVLGGVGDQSHARALIDTARLSDPGHASRLYEALAAVGGPDALGFLAFAAANEDDPTLSRLASQQLDRLRGVPATRPAAEGRRVARGHR